MDKELPVSAWPEWKIIEKIGEGSFGKVYKAQRTERGKSFYSAIKIINIPGSQSELNSVRSDIRGIKVMEMWFSDEHTDNVKLSIRVDKQLFSAQSEFR